MKNFLVVVDMQNDFIDGALGTAQAVEIVDNAANKIRNFDGKIFVTIDTHNSDYMSTSEGKKLPVVHCVKGTNGWKLNDKIADALNGKDYVLVEKPTFGSVELPNLINKDICVVSNALILKAYFYENDISVDSSCCAGVTPETHKAALEAMKMCQINIKP